MYNLILYRSKYVAQGFIHDKHEPEEQASKIEQYLTKRWKCYVIQIVTVKVLDIIYLFILQSDLCQHWLFKIIHIWVDCVGQ